MIVNNPKNAGSEIFGTSEIFGADSRYRVYAINTRFDAVAWFVADAEKIDDLGSPAIIRQESTKERAMLGLGEVA